MHACVAKQAARSSLQLPQMLRHLSLAAGRMASDAEVVNKVSALAKANSKGPGWESKALAALEARSLVREGFVAKWSDTDGTEPGTAAFKYLDGLIDDAGVYQ